MTDLSEQTNRSIRRSWTNNQYNQTIYLQAIMVTENHQTSVVSVKYKHIN
jgi:hypothetical protein